MYCGATLQVKHAIGFGFAIYETCGCPTAVAEKAEYEARVANQAKREAEQERRREEAHVQKCLSAIPERFRECSLDNYTVTAGNKGAVDLAKTFPFRTGKNGLLLMGTPGLGKTHIAAAIAVKFAREKRSVVFGTVPSILSRLKATFDSDSGENESTVMRRIIRCNLLVLDDLGKEKVTEWVEEKLYEIINGRYEANLPIVITTNVSMATVQERYGWNGEALVSRIFEMCRGVQLSGEDYRRRRG